MERESISVSPTEQKIACHANHGGGTDADSDHFVRSHMMLGFIVPIMIFSLCAAGR
jgi:hypothetical protein